LLACASRCIFDDGRVPKDTEGAVSLAIDRCRVRAQGVIEQVDLARLELIGVRRSRARRLTTVIVSGIINPFRRSHIFAVVGRHDGYPEGCRNQLPSFRELMG
jgi:hypothetical protein